MLVSFVAIVLAVIEDSSLCVSSNLPDLYTSPRYILSWPVIIIPPLEVLCVDINWWQPNKNLMPGALELQEAIIVVVINTDGFYL